MNATSKLRDMDTHPCGIRIQSKGRVCLILDCMGPGIWKEKAAVGHILGMLEEEVWVLERHGVCIQQQRFTEPCVKKRKHLACVATQLNWPVRVGGKMTVILPTHNIKLAAMTNCALRVTGSSLRGRGWVHI